MKAQISSRFNKHTFLPGDLIRKPYPVFEEVSDIDLAIKRVEMSRVSVRPEDFVSITEPDFKEALIKVRHLNDLMERLRIESATGKSTRPCKGDYVPRIFPVHAIKNLLWHLMDTHQSVKQLKCKMRPTSESGRLKQSKSLKVAKNNILKTEFRLVRVLLNMDANISSEAQFITVKRAYEIASDLIGSMTEYKDPRALRNAINRNLKIVSIRKLNGRLQLVHTPANKRRGSKVGRHHGKAKTPKPIGKFVCL